MISIIICSKRSQISHKLEQNIKATIGNIPYEIVVIDNSKNNYSIFQAYNKGVKEAKYSYLCFMHEDILFHSLEWGGVIISRLQHNIGILGVIGSHYIDQYSEYYHVPGICRGHILQGEYKNGTYYTTLDNRNKYKELGCNVVAVDGLWIASRKELFDNGILHWDEDTYKGFHFYDMDICIQAITQNLKVQIVDELLIEHKSTGNSNITFYDNCLLFHKKWNKYFPIMVPDIPFEILNDIFLQQIIKKKNSWKEIKGYNKLLNRLPYKIITKLLLMLRIKLYE